MIGHHNHAIHGPSHHRLAKMNLVLINLVSICDEHIVTMVTGNVLHRTHNGVVECVRNVGDHHSNHVGMLDAETTCCKIGEVAEVLHRVAHLLRGFLADRHHGGGLTQHTSHGAFRDSSQFCHLMHGN